MKKIRFKLLLSLALIAGIFTACEDEFSEKDALDAQQTIDLSVYVFDGFDQEGVADASVTVIKDGDEKSAETNELGVASFNDIKIGGNLPVQVKKDGFTPVQTMANINVNNYRQGSYTLNVPVLSLDTNTATVKGELAIETNLTNDSSEVPPVESTIKGYVHLSGVQPVELVAKTDENGEFEFTVPTTNQGVEFEIKYPTLTLDQTIAKNRNEGEPPFPETTPSITTISTTFNPGSDAITVPDVDPVYATVPAPSGEGERAVISDVAVNSSGEIIDVSFSNSGSGYTADSVDVTVTSLFEGSGANIKVGVSGGSLYSYNVAVKSGGSGYPTFSDANRVNGFPPSLYDHYNELKSGEIRVIEGHYGTGTYREQEIE
jgi:hypothetical protein